MIYAQVTVGLVRVTLVPLAYRNRKRDCKEVTLGHILDLVKKAPLF